MQIRPLTMSIVIGSAACNARCPFCVSKMTVENGVALKKSDIDFRNFDQAIALAHQSGVTTVLLTGKGEPTLFPRNIGNVLHFMEDQGGFPIVELQTNGIPIADGKIGYDVLRDWFTHGLRTIALSNVGFDPELNRRTYTPNRDKWIDRPALIAQLHHIGFTVRLATVMIKGGIDTPASAQQMIWYARDVVHAEQLTLRPVTAPSRIDGQNVEVRETINWIESEGRNTDGFNSVHQYIADTGVKLLELPHGGVVYDVDGQNVCITNCLTHSTDPDNIRQLIYFPDGHLRYSWEYAGAILL